MMARSRGRSMHSARLMPLVLLMLTFVHESYAQSAPSGCLKKNGIAVGWLPNMDKGGKMTDITNILGRSACYYGLYSQITSTTYDDSQLTSRMPDIKASGAILQPAVMPTGVRFADIGTNLASQIAASMKKFTDKGITVWLRFAHEVNYYVNDGRYNPTGNPTYPGGTPAEFIQAWRNVANAVRGNSQVKMFWSPNEESDMSKLARWWPGANYVDIVGIDIYPRTNGAASSFSGTYGSFIKAFSEAYNKPFAIGETGTPTNSFKSPWLTQLSAASSRSAYPSYVGFAWFEYLKDGEDFRAVTGPVDYAKPILT